MEDYYTTNQVITDYNSWASYCNVVADYFGAPIDHDQDNPPSYPCIATAHYIYYGFDYVGVDFVEVCDVEPGLEYNEELAGHVLAPELLKIATHMYM